MNPSDAVYLRSQTLEAVERTLRFKRASDVAAWMRDDGISASGQRMELGALRQAELFAWRHDLLMASISAADALPSPITISSSLMPVPVGLYVFERAVDLGAGAPVRGVSWVDLGGEALQVAVYQDDTKHFGAMSAFGSFVVKTGDRCIDNTVTEKSSADMRVKDRTFDLSSTFGVLKLLLASWLWVSQKVMLAESIACGRKAADNAKRLGVSPSVRVVTLRRATSATERESQGSEHEWSVQWIVRGHWRQQFYPKTNEHRPLWISPYVKGPEDKPLKTPQPTVFAVTR